MKTLAKIILTAAVFGMITGCAVYPSPNRYYSSSNNYYGQGRHHHNGYRGNVNANYGYPGYGNPYQNQRYQRPYYSYNGYNQQRPYCPDDD